MNGKTDGRNGVFKPAVRYSEGFKLEIVRELERELAPVDLVRRKYGIGVGTIQGWIAKYGNGSRGRIVRVETPKEISELKQLRERVRRLEMRSASWKRCSRDLARPLCCKRASFARRLGPLA